MLKRSMLLCAVAALFVSSGTWAADADTETKKDMIVESVKKHSADGACACPYNLAKDGSSCGKRSAYSKAGGEKPICFESDITPQMVQEYKGRKK